MSDVFELTPPPATDWSMTPTREETRSRRQQAARRSELARQAMMRRQFGPGPAGVTCKTCVSLLRRRRHHDGWYLKCARYRISASEATDWRAKWPACGAFEEA